MSLLVDSDYLIHSLRLAYLRRVDDSHGPRVISFPSIAAQRTSQSDGAEQAAREEFGEASGEQRFPPRHGALNQSAEAAQTAIERLAPDSHVVLAGLSNPSRYPELASCYSPKVSVAELSRPSRSEGRGPRGAMVDADGRLGGPGLKYTQTIYGPGRTGALGMRVSGVKAQPQPSGRRRSTASLSDEPHAQDLGRFAFGRRASHSEGSWQRAARGQGSNSEGGTSPSPGQTTFGQQLVPQVEVSAATVEASGSQTGARMLKKASPFDAPPMVKEFWNTSSPDVGGKRSLLDSFRQRRSSSGSASLGSDRRGSIPTHSSESGDPAGPSQQGGPYDPSLGRERSSSDADVERHKEAPSQGFSRPFDLLPGRRRSASEGASGFLRASNGSIETVRNNAGRRRSSARPSRPPSVLREEVDAEDSDDEAQGYEASSILARRAAIEEAMQQSDSDGEVEMYRAPNSRTGPDTTFSKSDSGFSLASLPANRPRRSLDRLAHVDGMPRVPRHVFTPVTELEEPVFPAAGQAQLPFKLALPQAQASLTDGVNDTLAATTYPASSEDEDVVESRSAMAQQFLSPFDADRKIQGAAMGASVESPMDTSQVGSLKGDPSPSWDPPDSQSAYRPLTAAESSLSPSINDELGLAASPTDVGGRAASQRQPAESEGIGRSGDESGASLPSGGAATRHPRPQERGEPKAVDSFKAAPKTADPQRKLQRSRSKAQRDGVASTNEWFQSLKSDAAAVKARNAKLPQTSALSAILKKQSAIPENPFAALYAGVAGRAVSAPGGAIEVDMYFPFAKVVPAIRKGDKTKSGAVSLDARAKSMRLSVRKDATMEELTGYALYCYVEEEWQPALEEGINPHNDEALDIRLTTVGWTMRIVEDGEVDDDYPAIDRSLTIGKFGADELAVCEATPAQVAQHRSAPGYVKRARPTGASGSVPSDASSSTPGTGLQPPASVVNPTATGAVARLAANNNAPAGSLINIAGTPIFASSALSRSANGPASTGIFLRVLVTPNPAVRYKTTLQVPSDMYLADVLETICRKRQLSSPDEWALIVPDKDIVVPLDRTVESLQGNHDLALVQRSTLGAQGGGALTGQSTNPNASIFKRFSEPAQPRYNKAKDLSSIYKSYYVNRKMPMFVGRHERNLVLDGEWLHVIPTDTRAFQAHAGSFPISSVVSCKVSRIPTHFKVVVAREGADDKRYDFEAESQRQAAEIVNEINTLRNMALGR